MRDLLEEMATIEIEALSEKYEVDFEMLDRLIADWMEWLTTNLEYQPVICMN